MLVLVVLLCLSGTSGSACEPWCVEPCAELNGNVAQECGACAEGSGCFPGAPGYAAQPDNRVHRVGISANAEAKVADDDGTGGADDAEHTPSCADRLDRSKCKLYAGRGDCQQHPQHMLRYCASTCGLCSMASASPCASQLCHQTLGLFDERFPRSRAEEECPPVARLLRGEHRCGDLENEERLKDRGYFVIRGAVSAAELEAMTSFVAALPHKATRLLCGASDVQPDECKLGPDELRLQFPRLHARLTELFGKWRSSGFNDAAELGWPLEISGSEFISINRWEFVHNASCVLNAVYAAAEEHVDAPRARRACIRLPMYLPCISQVRGRGGARRPAVPRGVRGGRAQPVVVRLLDALPVRRDHQPDAARADAPGAATAQSGRGGISLDLPPPTQCMHPAPSIYRCCGGPERTRRHTDEGRAAARRSTTRCSTGQWST